MALFLNIFGSALLIGAGAAVFLKILCEMGVIKKELSLRSLNEEKALPSTMAVIFILALLSRWIVFFICYLLNGSGAGFGHFIYAAFEKAGDTPHYLYIAQNGYQSTGEKANLIVFYPLYPLLMRIVHFIIPDYLAAGIVVSDICFGLASCFLYKLLILDYGRAKAWFGTLMLFAAPFGLFFGAVYTESVFLLTTVLCMYCMRKDKYALMAVFGFLSCLSRTQGVILFLIALYTLIIKTLKEKKINIKLAVSTFVIPIGFLCYLFMNKLLFGSFFKYMEFQAAAPWYNTAHWFGKTLSQSFNMARDYEGLANIIYYPQLIFFFVSAAAIFYGLYKKVNTGYLIYCGVYTFTCYTHGWLISGSRYMCACVPLFIIFAACDNKYIKTALLLICAVLYFIVTKLWLMGYSIM